MENNENVADLRAYYLAKSVNSMKRDASFNVLQCFPDELFILKKMLDSVGWYAHMDTVANYDSGLLNVIAIKKGS
jgi:hypothetical protein